MYNHPAIKKQNWYVKLFENNETFHVLKTTSRLAGFVALLIAYLVSPNSALFFISFPATIMLVDIIFFVLRKKESHFKSEKFFISVETTPKSMDKYNLILLIVKGIAFIALIPLIQFYLYGIICTFLPLIVAPIAKYAPYIGDRTKNRSHEDTFPIHKFHETSSGSSSLGGGGYNLDGTYNPTSCAPAGNYG